MLLWGANDVFLGREMARASVEQCQQSQLVMFEDATYWVHYEDPVRVNALLETFLREGPGG